MEGFFQFLLRKDLKSFSRLVGKLIPVRLDEDVVAALGAHVTLNVVTVEAGRHLTQDELKAQGLEQTAALPPPEQQVAEPPATEPPAAAVYDEPVALEDYVPPPNIHVLHPYGKKDQR